MTVATYVLEVMWDGAAWTDETTNLIQAEWRRGRDYASQLSGRATAGTFEAILQNPSGRYASLNASSPLYGLIKPGRKVRVELRQWVRRVHDATGMTTLFVTHDQDEAMEVANRVVIMNQGRIEQEGSPQRIFDRPATQFVADFVGETNSIEVEAEEDGLAVWGPLRFSISPKIRKGRRVRIYFRPHDVYVTRQKESLQVPARIGAERFKGAFTELDLDLGGERRILAHLPRGLAEASGYGLGQSVWLGITGFHVFEVS